MRDVQQKTQQITDKLTPIHFWAYGVGHFINDLVVACWFNFLLFFLKRVAQTLAAPYVLLIGQITDGLTTPLVGFFSDKYETRFGKRMPWYVFGVILVSVSFLPLFIVINSDSEIQFIYYVGFGIIFSIGWAAVQISHMSLVPSLTLDRRRRDRLNNLRNTFTFISNLFVLSLSLIVFAVIEDNQIQFLLIAIVTLSLGIATSVFYISISNKDEVFHNEITNVEEKYSSWRWFRMPAFYLFGLCYMGVRVYTNIFGTLLPFYLVSVLKMGSNTESGVSFNIALVPLVCYFSSAIAASRMNWFYQNFGRKKALALGTIVCILSLTGIYFLIPRYSWGIYCLSIFIGISQALVLSTGINLISEVVGPRGSKGAFVFGIYSFVDKIMVGVIIYLVSNTPAYTKRQMLTNQELLFIKLTICIISGGGCLIGALIVMLYPIPQYTEGNRLISSVITQESRKNLV